MLSVHNQPARNLLLLVFAGLQRQERKWGFFAIQLTDVTADCFRDIFPFELRSTVGSTACRTMGWAVPWHM